MQCRVGEWQWYTMCYQQPSLSLSLDTLSFTSLSTTIKTVVMVVVMVVLVVCGL